MGTHAQAAKIMTEFKEHSQEEVSVPPTISYNLSSPLLMDGKSSGYIMSRSQNGSLPRREEYKLEYWGRYEVHPPASRNTDQVELIDSLVAKLREVPSSAGSTLSKFRTKKRSFGSRFMSRSSAAKVGVEDVDSVANAGQVAGSMEPLDAKSSPSQTRPCRSNSEGQDGLDITVTAASPTPDEEEGSSTSPEDPADHHSSCPQMTASTNPTSQTTNPADHHLLSHDAPNPADHQDTPNPANQLSLQGTIIPANASKLNDRVRTESSGFDTIPELANLKSSSEFQALSLQGTHGAVQKVRLLFSGVSVMVYLQHSEQIILKKSIQNIACCAQVS